MKIFTLIELDGMYEIENAFVIGASYDRSKLEELKKKGIDELFEKIKKYDRDFYKRCIENESFEKTWKDTNIGMDNGCGKFMIQEVEVI